MICHWKWSTGDEYSKSARLKKDDTDVRNVDETMFLSTSSIFSRNQLSTTTTSKRECIDEKISDREMLAQRGVNPFLQTNYVNDIVTCDNFLKPINTTFERTKNEN